MLDRRHLIQAALGASSLAAMPPPSAPAAAPAGDLGPENAALAPYAGLWELTETVWPTPDSAPVTTTGLVAERRMIGPYLQEMIRPATDNSGQDIKRIDYLSFQRLEGRWKYVSIELRIAVGIMPAYSVGRGDGAGIVLVHDAFALPAGGAAQMLRMTTTVTRDGPDRDAKTQHFMVADGTGVSWLAHRYAYARRG